MAKKKAYDKKSFESNGTSSDTSSNVYMSMLMSDAWRELSAKQQVLYLYCKAQYYAEKRKPNNNPLAFTMNQSKWSSLYGLYTLKNKNAFYRDMTVLIEKGFVVCIESGAVSRTKSIYAFSDKWQIYGTEAFAVLPSEMTLAMRKKQNQKEL